MININDKAYAFTNENVSSFENLYDFNGAKVLSVIGSGDQYFASLLYGAKKIVLYDYNPNAWLYFIFKFYALRELSYEEFLTLFVYDTFNNRNIFAKVINSMPPDIARKVVEQLKRKGGLSSFILYSSLSNNHKIIKVTA